MQKKTIYIKKKDGAPGSDGKAYGIISRAGEDHDLTVSAGDGDDRELYKAAVCGCYFDLSTSSYSRKINRRQLKVLIKSDDLPGDLTDSVRQMDCYSCFDMIVPEEELTQEKLRDILAEGPEAAEGEVVFVCSHMNRSDEEHRAILDLSRLLGGYGIRTIVIASAEYDCLSDDIEVFDPEDVTDIKLSMETDREICEAILRHTTGSVIICSTDGAEASLRNRPSVPAAAIRDLYERIRNGEADRDSVMQLLSELSAGPFVSPRPEQEEAKKRGVKNAVRNSAFMKKNNRYLRLSLLWRRLKERGSSPLVSVVVPFYNNNATLDDTLRSIRKNGYGNIEAIVINDGSDQDPQSIVRKYRFARYIRKDNGGLGDTRNRGVEEAKGKYVIFLDSDDTLCQGGITALVDCAEKNGLDVTAGRTRRVEKESGRARYWRKKTYTKSYINDMAHRQLLIEDTLATAKLYRTEYLKSGQHRFDKGLYEDMPFIADVYRTAERIGIVRNNVQNWMIYGLDMSITTRITADNVLERLRRLDQVFERQTEALKVYYTTQFINRQMIYCINGFSRFSMEDRRTVFAELRKRMLARSGYIRSAMLPVYSREKMAGLLLADDYDGFEKLALCYSDRYFTRREELQQAGDDAETVK